MFPPEGIFEVLLEAHLNKSHLSVSWNPEPVFLPADMRREVDAFWESLLGGRHSSTILFDGKLCRLEKHRFDGGRLELALGWTRYRHALYCNDHVHEIRNRWGEEYLSNALGVSAVVVSADKRIILMDRSQHVGECPGFIDVFGGHIDPENDIEEGIPSPFAGIRAELQEELGLEDAEVASLMCTGLITNLQNLKPELVFTAHTRLGAQELRRRAQSAEGTKEFVGLRDLPDTGDALELFLRTRQDSITPSAYGSLWLYGRRKRFWGTESA